MSYDVALAFTVYMRCRSKVLKYGKYDWKLHLMSFSFGVGNPVAMLIFGVQGRNHY